MVVVSRKNSKQFYQERLSADDIALLLKAIQNVGFTVMNCSDTRLELLTAKLVRMEKQK
jgi:hypothetical protein